MRDIEIPSRVPSEGRQHPSRKAASILKALLIRNGLRSFEQLVQKRLASMKLLTSVAVAVLLSGCASITMTHVGPTGQPIPGAAEGFYVPRLMPYLFVADLPSGQAQTSPKNAPIRQGHAGAAAGAPSTPVASPTTATTMKSEGDKSTTPAATSSDLSFQAMTQGYIIKLVYLPDYSQQQVISAKSGWFGKASLQIGLLDGTITSLNANTDNTENGEVLKSAMTALITAASGGAAGAPSAGAAAAGHAGAPAGQATATFAKSDALIHPGIYRLVYDETTGKLVGVVRMTGFCSNTGSISLAQLNVPNAKTDACAP